MIVFLPRPRAGLDGVTILQKSFEILGVPETASREEIRAAYRKLARRWHPDRFAPGPERDWANEQMATINAAYRQCLNNPPLRSVEPEETGLAEVQRLIDDGQLSAARQRLMAFTTRCAEWNYLFGALLVQTAEYEKAVLYLSVAAHQSPGEYKYMKALEGARRLAGGRRRGFLPRLGIR